MLQFHLLKLKLSAKLILFALSDKPGHHNFELLHKLVLPDGSILRAQLPGRPTRDCLFCDPARDGTRSVVSSFLPHSTRSDELQRRRLTHLARAACSRYGTSTSALAWWVSSIARVPAGASSPRRHACTMLPPGRSPAPSLPQMSTQSPNSPAPTGTAKLSSMPSNQVCVAHSVFCSSLNSIERYARSVVLFLSLAFLRRADSAAKRRSAAGDSQGSRVRGLPCLSSRGT